MIPAAGAHVVGSKTVNAGLFIAITRVVPPRSRPCRELHPRYDTLIIEKGQGYAVLVSWLDLQGPLLCLVITIYPRI